MSDTDLNFGFDLTPTGDAGSGFHFRNAPGEIQRPTVVDHHTSIRSDLSIQGNLITIIHGKLASDGPRGTLIVARFQFTGSRHSRRFRSAKISFKFRNDQEFLNCSVNQISPFGEYALNPSWNHQGLKLGTGGNVGFNAIAAAGVQATYELTKDFDRQDRGAFCGGLRTEGRNYGSKNTAWWSMSQNKTQKSGIPTLLDVAMLLERGDDEPFFAEVKVNAEVDVLYDFESRVQGFWGSNYIDPIKFDPRYPQMGDTPKDLDENNLSSYPLANLGTIGITPSLYTVERQDQVPIATNA